MTVSGMTACLSDAVGQKTYPCEGSWPVFDFTLLGDTLFFSANDGTHGRELWKTDGTEAGTVLVKDINPGQESASYYTSTSFDPWTVVNDTLFFIADDGTTGYELWKSDGTTAGTTLVKDIRPGGHTPFFFATNVFNNFVMGNPNFSVIDDTLFFIADDGTTGYELWKSDGTTAGTTVVKDLMPGSDDSFEYGTSYTGMWDYDIVTSLSNTGSEIFFSFKNDTYGNELWVSDGTEAGTVLVKDINPLNADSNPGGFLVAGDKFFFNATDDQSYKFWQSDGTEAGTVVVLDEPYFSSKYINGTLFFATSSYPSRLYALQLAPAASTFDISGSISDANGDPLAGVTITASDGSSTTSSSDGSYTLGNLEAGTYTLTLVLDGYTFTPASRTVTVPPDASGQDFSGSASAPSDGFQVDRDGFSFGNFRYYGASWEHFKKTFPDTEMELPSGERRKGPERYFQSNLYTPIGEGGNCAGFTAVSLISFLGLNESVEPDLLLPAHRSISPLYAWPEPIREPFDLGESDIADYIHLYQARQLSWQFNQWWFEQNHIEDTPQEVFQSITQYTQNNEPVAVDIFQEGQGGHRMTAYRTEQDGNTGSIYVYDNNWPGDETRRIEMNLTTGRWSYALSPNRTWSGTADIRYSPGSLNFPASLPWWYDTDHMLQSNVLSGTQLGIEGDATLLMTDKQGRKLGFENGTLVSDIPGAGYLPILEFDLDNPDAPEKGVFYLPGDAEYVIAVLPTATGSYTLTAFADGSGMSLDNIAITNGTTDMAMLDNGVRTATFDLATDTDYCHYATLEVSATASRDYQTCVSGDGAAEINLSVTKICDHHPFRTPMRIVAAATPT